MHQTHGVRDGGPTIASMAVCNSVSTAGGDAFAIGATEAIDGAISVGLGERELLTLLCLRDRLEELEDPGG